MPTNVLLITADELRGDCVGYDGNVDIRTPHLDAFAARAAAFMRHFTVHGKCVPSRIAMVTGRYCHSDGIRSINEENHLPSGTPCLLSTLKLHGYESAVFGHNHVWSDFWGQDNRKSTSIVDYHSFTVDGGFGAMAMRKWPGDAPRSGAPQPLDLSDGWAYGGRSPDSGGFADDNRIDQAVRFLREVRDRSRPFYLHVNLGKPHPPYEIEEPWYSLYDRAALRAWPRQLASNAPLHLRELRRIRTGEAEDERACREVQAVYYGMVSKVDALVGRLLATVSELGLYDDTVVIFTADHGDFAGQYQLIEKWDTAMNDCILRVPLIVAAPGLAPMRVRGLSEHVDLAPTVLDLLGIAPAPEWTMHGASLRAALGGAAAKDEVFADGGHEAALRRRFSIPLWHDDPHSGRRVRATAGKQHTYHDVPDTMARAKMVRTARWKLVMREVGGDELYDLEADPWELENLHGRRELLPQVAELQGRLLRWCLRTDPDRPRLASVGA
jgi:choline-sulfatase